MNIAQKYREFAELDSNHAFLTVTLLISSAFYEGSAEDRLQDLIELQRAHLENIGQESLGWALTARYVEAEGVDKAKGSD